MHDLSSSSTEVIHQEYKDEDEDYVDDEVDDEVDADASFILQLRGMCFYYDCIWVVVKKYYYILYVICYWGRRECERNYWLYL
jgi:hypothetical protein